MSYSPQMAAPNNSLALASVILGAIASGIAFAVGTVSYGMDPLLLILTLMVTGVPGLLAIIFGFIGVSTANRLNGKRRAQAVWGIVLGFSPILALFLGGILRAGFIGL